MFWFQFLLVIAIIGVTIFALRSLRSDKSLAMKRLLALLFIVAAVLAVIFSEHVDGHRKLLWRRTWNRLLLYGFIVIGMLFAVAVIRAKARSDRMLRSLPAQSHSTKHDARKLMSCDSQLRSQILKHDLAFYGTGGNRRTAFSVAPRAPSIAWGLRLRGITFWAGAIAASLLNIAVASIVAGALGSSWNVWLWSLYLQ